MRFRCDPRTKASCTETYSERGPEGQVEISLNQRVFLFLRLQFAATIAARSQRLSMRREILPLNPKGNSDARDFDRTVRTAHRSLRKKKELLRKDCNRANSFFNTPICARQRLSCAGRNDSCHHRSDAGVSFRREPEATRSRREAKPARLRPHRRRRPAALPD